MCIECRLAAVNVDRSSNAPCFTLDRDRKRMMDREELWQRLEQQASNNYANLSAQGNVYAPLPPAIAAAEPVPAPLGKPTQHGLNCSAKHTVNICDWSVAVPVCICIDIP